MEVRIIESSHGGYNVQFGCEVKHQDNPFGIGQIMPAFIVYRSLHCDTLMEAEKVAETIADGYFN